MNQEFSLRKSQLFDIGKKKLYGNDMEEKNVSCFFIHKFCEDLCKKNTQEKSSTKSNIDIPHNKEFICVLFHV